MISITAINAAVQSIVGIGKITSDHSIAVYANPIYLLHRSIQRACGCLIIIVVMLNKYCYIMNY